jgi:hypothetical protein
MPVSRRPKPSDKKDEWTDFVANVLELEIREPAVKHQVSIAQVKRWLDGSVQDPREQVKRERLKAMLGK